MLIQGDAAVGEVSSCHANVFAMVGNDIHQILMFKDTCSQTPQKFSSNGPVPKSLLILDSQAIIVVISNGELLTNIHSIQTTLHIRCNAGVKTTNMHGNLSGYGSVWYFPAGIANILSLSM